MPGHKSFLLGVLVTFCVFRECASITGMLVVGMQLCSLARAIAQWHLSLLHMQAVGVTGKPYGHSDHMTYQQPQLPACVVLLGMPSMLPLTLEIFVPHTD